MFRPNGKAKNVTQDVVALFVLQDTHQQKSISDNFHGQKYSKIKKLYCSLTPSVPNALMLGRESKTGNDMQ